MREVESIDEKSIANYTSAKLEHMMDKGLNLRIYSMEEDGERVYGVETLNEEDYGKVLEFSSDETEGIGKYLEERIKEGPIDLEVSAEDDTYKVSNILENPG